MSNVSKLLVAMTINDTNKKLNVMSLITRDPTSGLKPIISEENVLLVLVDDVWFWFIVVVVD